MAYRKAMSHISNLMTSELNDIGLLKYKHVDLSTILKNKPSDTKLTDKHPETKLKDKPS